jgi:hypothetical protein
MGTAAADFAGKHPEAAIFTRGGGSVVMLAAVQPHRLILKAVGAVPSENVVGILRDLRAAGHLTSDTFHALIDLTEFTGGIDWDEIKQISEVMPKGDSATNRNAYVVRDSFLAMIAKITAAMFPNTECAAFTAERDALAWLQWD